MSEPLSGLAKHSFQQTLSSQTLQTPKEPQKSFANHLETGNNPPNTDGLKPANEPAPVSGAGLQNALEQLQADLTKKTSRVGSNNNSLTSSIPNLINPETRSNYLQEAFQGLSRNPATSDLKGYAVNVENKWKEVEDIMSSKTPLSQGQLLALQARLYQVSQHIEVMSKVVDQMAGGIKTVLNTNV